MRYPSWAKARKMMKNMTAKPARSLAQAPSVDDSCVIVLLKLMYLKICAHRQMIMKTDDDDKCLNCQKLTAVKIFTLRSSFAKLLGSNNAHCVVIACLLSN